MLHRWDMKVTGAESAEEALERLSSARNEGEPYALILADMHLLTLMGSA